MNPEYAQFFLYIIQCKQKIVYDILASEYFRSDLLIFSGYYGCCPLFEILMTSLVAFFACVSKGSIIPDTWKPSLAANKSFMMQILAPECMSAFIVPRSLPSCLMPDPSLF